jgi:hypothetical protein
VAGVMEVDGMKQCIPSRHASIHPSVASNEFGESGADPTRDVVYFLTFQTVPHQTHDRVMGYPRRHSLILSSTSTNVRRTSASNR